MSDIIESTISPSATSDAPVVEPQPVASGEDVVQGDQPEETPASEPEGAADEDESADEPKEPGDQPKKPKGVQKRIDELVREREDAKRERDHWREMATKQAGKPPVEPPAQADPAPGLPQKPKTSDFESYDEYVEALTDWKANEREAKRVAEQMRETVAKQEQAFAAKAHAVLQAGEGKFEDFAEVMQGARNITQAMAMAIAESEMGADIAYHLGKNQDEAARIAALPPIAQAREIGKMEARMEAQAKAAPKPEPRTVTKAPPPIRPVGSSERVNKDPATMSFAEYEAWRKAK